MVSDAAQLDAAIAWAARNVAEVAIPRGHDCPAELVVREAAGGLRGKVLVRCSRCPAAMIVFIGGAGSTHHWLGLGGICPGLGGPLAVEGIAP